MSEYVVHFTRGTDQLDAYDAMISILSTERLEARKRFGAARKLRAPDPPQKAVCFSEIPLDRLDRLVKRRGSSYGIGFRQDVLSQAGGGRVWYVDKGSNVQEALQDLIGVAFGPPFDAQSPLWRLTPFIDFPGDYGGTQYRFEWEREWRVPGDFEFQASQVAFLFLPETQHAQARRFFDSVSNENLGPSYTCAFLDPLWTDDTLQKVLADI